MEKEAKDKLDHPDWAKRFKLACKLAYDQKRPEWSYESSGAYNEWVRQCHAKGAAAIEKLVPEAENGYQRRQAQLELVKLTEGDARDKWCLKLLDDPETDEEQKVRLRALVVDNLAFDRGCWNWLYEARHIRFRDEQEVRARQERFLKMCREEIAAHAEDREVCARRACELGDAYATLGNWPEAEKWYRESGRLKSGIEAAFGVAECLFQSGRREEAVRELKDLNQKFGVKWIRTSCCYNRSLLASYALRFLEGTTLNGLGLPRGSLCKAFPTPKSVVYEDRFVAAPQLTLMANGIAADDAHFRFFRKKMQGRGFSFAADGGYPVKVSLRADAPVNKPEGYSLKVGEAGAEITARDAQGVLWGLVSLVQVSRRDDPALRVCEMTDWPDLARRGYFGGFWPDCTEFTVMCKMNFVAHQGHPETDQFFSPLRTYLNESLAAEFRDLGLTLHYGIVGLTQCPQLPICDRRTFDYRLEVFRHYAKMGAGIYWPFDDVRFPVIEQDLKAFGPKAGTVADARHINELYQATVADCPGFSLIFCPPFYWGPDSEAWRSYPESLYEYLPSVRSNLDARVHVVWTGPRVKGWKKEKHKVKWYADLIGRKPLIFQNAAGAHNLLNYTVDVTDWNRWMHYPGFYDDISAYLKNSATPCDCPQLTTLADCLWNDGGYDANRSVREGVTMLMGDGVFEALDEGAAALEHFDTYKYGSVYTDKLCKHENPALKGENEADLLKKVELVRRCHEKAKKLAPREMGLYGSYGRGVGFAAQVLEAYQRRYGSKRTRPRDKEDVITLDENEIPADSSGGIEEPF